MVSGQLLQPTTDNGRRTTLIGGSSLDCARAPAIAALQETLEGRVLGQTEPLAAIVDAYARWKAHLAGTEKPVAAFLMLGPTGVGKTLTVEALAEVLHGDSRRMIKLHCAEYRQSHEVARLLGAPPGYVGHRETEPRLSPARIREAQSDRCGLVLVLFDEIEKAHPDLWDTLLGVLDKGELHLGNGGCADLRESMIFLTSNAGSREAGHRPGFHVGAERALPAHEEAARALFAPEFRNRLTATLIYRPLSDEEILRVAELELKRSAERLLQAAGTLCTFTSSAIRTVAQAGKDPAFGARPVRRAIERLVELPLAHLLISGQVKRGDEVACTALDGKLRFHKHGATGGECPF